MTFRRLATALLLAFMVIGGQGQRYDQGYDDYSQDNLYHDYAMKQQDKVAGKGGGGMVKAVIGFASGWFIGSKIHCRRQAKKLNAKHKNDQKQLYTQYYNDVYTLQEQNAELVKALEQMGVRAR